MRTPLVLSAAAALMATACGAAGSTGATEAPATSPVPSVVAPTAAVERVSIESLCYGACAYVTPSGLPEVVVDAVSGDVFSLAQRRGVGVTFPVTVLHSSIGRTQVDHLLELVRAAGLPGDTSYPALRSGVGVSDGGGTVFRVSTGAGDTALEAKYLSPDEDQLFDAPGHRPQLLALQDALRALEGAGTAYPAGAHAVVAEALPGAAGSPQVRWSGPALDELPEVVGGVGCAVLSDRQLAEVDPVLRAADQPLVATAAGRSWSVQLRPLLPYEHDCADLGLRHSEY